jgi:hypothetical protein
MSAPDFNGLYRFWSNSRTESVRNLRFSPIERQNDGTSFPPKMSDIILILSYAKFQEIDIFCTIAKKILITRLLDIGRWSSVLYLELELNIWELLTIHLIMNSNNLNLMQRLFLMNEFDRSIELELTIEKKNLIRLINNRWWFIIKPDTSIPPALPSLSTS